MGWLDEKVGKLCQEAIQLKDGKKMIQLALLYVKGIHVEQDYIKAKELFEKAGEIGYAFAIYGLANLYYYGLGVEQDESKSFKLYKKALKRGYKGALTMVCYLYYTSGINKEEKIKELYEKAIEFNDANAMVHLADIYLLDDNKKECGENDRKAKELYERAARFNNTEGIIGLALLYDKGIGVEKDNNKVIELYKTAIKKDNNVTAINNLAFIYLEQNKPNKSIKLWNKAVKLNDTTSMINLADLLKSVNGYERVI